MTHCKRIIIIEGVDGAGKSTLAASLSKALGAVVHHHGPYLSVVNGPQLARIYVDSMMPALLGEYDVILDRSWLSEPIYGAAYRGGVDRLGTVLKRQLERLALRCGAVVVRCDPGWSSVEESWSSRKGLEYLKNLKQLSEVHLGYRSLATALPVRDYDYTKPTDLVLTSHPHPLVPRTAGRMGARLVMVGEGFAAHKPEDHDYQWPFGSFSNQGCSGWLTERLEDAGVGEDELLWANADQDLTWLDAYQPDDQPSKLSIFALGVSAWTNLTRSLTVPNHVLRFDHPQSWKRFRTRDPYPLLNALKAHQ